MNLIDQEYYDMQVKEDVESYIIDQSQKQMSKMEKIICNEDRIKEVVSDIITHYEDRKNKLQERL